MSSFIHDLPADAYIPTNLNDIGTSFYHHPSPSFSETSLPSPPTSPPENYPSHILWAPRLRTVELPDEEDPFVTAPPDGSYYEVPYGSEFEEQDIQLQMDEIIEDVLPAFLLRFEQNQGYESNRQHTSRQRSPYLTPPQKFYPITPSPRSILSSMVKEDEDVIKIKAHSQTINADGYGVVPSCLSPLPHVMVCAPITLSKLLPRWV